MRTGISLVYALNHCAVLSVCCYTGDDCHELVLELSLEELIGEVSEVCIHIIVV